MFDKIVKEMASLKEVAGVMLGGSRALNTHDLDSDYDVYVYFYTEIPEESRRTILQKYVKYMEYSNSFWELEDDGILNNGVDIEFIYRDINTIEEGLRNTLNGMVGNGYSTCFIDNFYKSKILYEEDNVLTKMRERLATIDNQKMFDSVVLKNIKLLRDSMPSLYYQIDKAVKRNDQFSINHRLAEYFAIYFDILFALNKATHPGEKRLLAYANKLDSLPNNFEKNTELVFNNVYQNNTAMLKALEGLTEAIYSLVRKQGYDVSYNSYQNTQS